MTERQAELEAWKGEPLTADEVEFINFLIPVKAYEGNVIKNAVPCSAWLRVDKSYLNYPIPPDACERVYGDATLQIQLKDFSITTMEIPDTNDVVFVLSANYNLNPKPPLRDSYTSATDAKDWVPYITALGFTFAELLTVEEAMLLVNPIVEE